MFVFKECESLFSKNNQVTKKDDEVPDEKIILPNIYRLIESQLEINQQCKKLSALKKRCAELLVQKQEGRNIKGEAIESHSHQRSKKLVAETPNVLPFSEICKVIDKVYPDISEFAPDDFFLSTSSLSSRATSSMERFP